MRKPRIVKGKFRYMLQSRAMTNMTTHEVDLWVKALRFVDYLNGKYSLQYLRRLNGFTVVTLEPHESHQMTESRR